MSGHVHNPADVTDIQADVANIDGDAMRGTDDAALASVCTSVRGGYIDQLHANTGASATGKAITSTIHVSPDGDGTNGYTWSTAYQTIQDALDNASTDADDCTLILISPHATNYDINTTGDPTWAANVILKGSHRNWAKIMNTHGAATSIMKLTGKSAVIDLNFNLGTGNNGLIMTHGGHRVYSCQFVGEDLTGAATALHLDHASGGKHAKVIDCDFLGDASPGALMTAILIDEWGYSNFERIRIHRCFKGIQFVGTASDENTFNMIDIGECVIGLDIDAGSENHFYEVVFHHNTRDVDSEIQDQIWMNIYGQFPIYITPDNLTGTAVACGAANTYGGDTQLIAANAIDNPFRIVGVTFAPSASPAEWYMVRFSADSGSTWYDTLMFLGDKREGIAAPSGTEFIFNADTRISCSAKSVSGGNNVNVWLEIQEL